TDQDGPKTEPAQTEADVGRHATTPNIQFVDQEGKRQLLDLLRDDLFGEPTLEGHQMVGGDGSSNRDTHGRGTPKLGDDGLTSLTAGMPHACPFGPNQGIQRPLFHKPSGTRKRTGESGCSIHSPRTRHCSRSKTPGRAVTVPRHGILPSPRGSARTKVAGRSPTRKPSEHFPSCTSHR